MKLNNITLKGHREHEYVLISKININLSNIKQLKDADSEYNKN